MGLLITLLICLALFIGFLMLTGAEKKRGTRLFGRVRDAFDVRVEEGIDTMRHADLVHAMFRAVLKFGTIIAHDITAAALRAVRMLERFLASLHLNLRHTRAADGTGSGFVKSITHFKKNLRTAHPPAADATPSAVE
jgi:hypothetical protein